MNSQTFSIWIFTLSTCLIYMLAAAEGRRNNDSRGESQIVYSSHSKEINCPKNRPFVDCVISPCKAERILGIQCEAYPEATCTNELCGGCVAKHYFNGREVHCGKDRDVICELQNSSISCPINYIMKINSANYGRTDTSTCRHSYNFDAMHNNTSCFSSNATSIIRGACEGHTACWPEVSSQVFGDPCHGIYKYLKVDFDCVHIRSYYALKLPDIEISQLGGNSTDYIKPVNELREDNYQMGTNELREGNYQILTNGGSNNRVSWGWLLLPLIFVQI